MTFVSTLAQTQSQIARLKDLQFQLGTLQSQISTGKKTQTFSGLGADVTASIKSRGNFNRLDSYIQNIDMSTTRIKLQLQGISGIQDQTKIIIGAMQGQIQAGDIDVSTIKRLADSAYQYVVSTLNLKDGNAYVYAGSDTSVQPVTDSGSLDSYMSSLNAQWTAGTLPITPPNTTIAEEYNSRLASIPQVTQGYSGSLGSAKSVYVKADDQVNINTTVLANDPALQDIVRALAALKDIGDLNQAPGGSAQAQKDNFYAVFNNITTTLQSASTKLDTQGSNLAYAQAQLTTIRDDHVQEQATLQDTIDNVENVDLNEAAVKVQALGTQLQASYQVTALINKLSLSNYI
jgi:flagellar hook-associated protein 3 FlgL